MRGLALRINNRTNARDFAWRLAPTGWTECSEGRPWQSGHVHQRIEASGRWGSVPASEHQEILVALASRICAQRCDKVLTILDDELLRC